MQFIQFTLIILTLSFQQEVCRSLYGPVDISPSNGRWMQSERGEVYISPLCRYIISFKLSLSTGAENYHF